MSEIVRPLAEWCAVGIETLGVLLITVTAIYAVCIGVWKSARGEKGEVTFWTVRKRFGLGILLGLEFLVAADIIHTVAVELSFTTVGVLSIIVLVRTFLSFTLNVELTGRWPWQEEEPDLS